MQFRQDARKEELLTWEEKRRYLAKVVNDPETPVWIVLQAIKLDNKMADHDRPPQDSEEREPVLKRILENLKPTLGLPEMPKDEREKLAGQRVWY